MSRIYIKTYDLSTSDPGQGVRNFCYRNNFSTHRKADGTCCDGLIRTQLMDSYKDKRADYLIIAHDGTKPVAWSMAYTELGRKMFQAYVPVRMRRKGIGSRMLKAGIKKLGRVDVYDVDTSGSFFRANGLTKGCAITGKRLKKA